MRNLAAHSRPDIAALYRACSHGLDLFFVISGFALAYPIVTLVHQEGQTYLDVSRYALKRILRIVPTYYVVLALTVAVPLVAAHFGLGALEGPAPAKGDLIRQALFVGAIPTTASGRWRSPCAGTSYFRFSLALVRFPIGFGS